MSKALLSVNNYYYLRGGAEKVFLEHNDLLTAEGWRVAPFAMQGEKNLATPWDKYFVQEIEFGETYSLSEKLVNAVKIIHSPEAKRHIRRLIEDLKPDVAHAHNIYHHLSTSILPELKRHDVPVVLTLHDLKIACPAYTMLSGQRICEDCKSGLYHVVKNRCLKGSLMLSGLIMLESYFNQLFGLYRNNVDKFVVPSQFYIDKFVEWGFERSRFVHIPNFVESKPQQPGSEVEAMKTDYLVYAGRLSYEKGLPTLIDAVIELGYPLKVAGSGPLESMLKQKVATAGATNIEFLGHLSQEQLANLVAGCRAVVAPSEWYENCPMSVIEAFLAGKIVVGSDIGGISEMIDHNVDGFKFPMGDVAALTELLRQVADLPKDQIVEMGQNAQAKAASQYSKQQYLEKTLALYDSF